MRICGNLQFYGIQWQEGQKDNFPWHHLAQYIYENPDFDPFPCKDIFKVPSGETQMCPINSSLERV